MRNKVNTFFDIFFLFSWCLGACYTLYTWLNWHDSEVLSVKVNVCIFILIWAALSNLRKEFGVAIIWLIGCYEIFLIIDKLPEFDLINKIEICYDSKDCEAVKNIKGMEHYIDNNEQL
ncbi:MAG: hypothetical protein J6Y53_03070 [Alphaproteobacteria bacterium]|nr:hypothetical protein [Alphaproteobacteria bacterium]